MANTFSAKISGARLMAAGIRSHLKELKSVSLKAQSANKIESLAAKAQTLDTKQEKLKAELKSCTAALKDTLSQMDSLCSDAKKRVKLAVAKPGWKEFGVADKK